MNECRAETLSHWVEGLVRDHTRFLVAVAQREGLTAMDALDAVQDSFHRLLEFSDGLALRRDPDRARARLATLVRNTARNMRRRHHRARPHEPVEDQALAHPNPPVDQLLVDAQDLLRVQACLQQLKDVQQRVVRLRMLEELSGQEVAERLGLSAGHVAVLLHRARQQLSDCVSVG